MGNDFILSGTDSYLHKAETYFNCLHQQQVDGMRREDIRLITSAGAMGVRETHRIDGEHTLTIDDVLSGRQVTHGDRFPPPGQSDGVPYRCLLPNDAENLLVAVRSLSATHETLASVRMMASCMAMGQAAGTAAAIAFRDSAPPHRWM